MTELPPATQKRVLSGAVRNERSSVRAAGRHHRPLSLGAAITQPTAHNLLDLLSKMFLLSERITSTRHSLCNCQMNADAVRHHMETQGRPSAPAALAQPRCPPPRPALLQNPHEGPAQWARGWRARRRAARWGRVGSSVGVRTWDCANPRGHPG